MPITGLPKSLDDRSFNTAHPLFNGLACFYYGGSNKNLLVQRTGRQYADFDAVPSLSYVDVPLNNLPTSKAIVGATERDTIILDIPTTPLTNDLPGIYNDFTILIWAKLIKGGVIFSLNNSGLDANSIWINSFIDANLPDGTGGGNMFVNMLGSTAVLSAPGSAQAIKGVNALYVFKKQGLSVTVSINDIPGFPETIPNIGTITLSGLALLNRTTLEPFDSRMGIAQTSLIMVYKRALSHDEVLSLHSNPFIFLPDPGGLIIPPVTGYRKQIRGYNIGNSVTDTINPSKLEIISNDNLARYIWARQTVLGAPLEVIQQSPLAGFIREPYGYPGNAFVNYTWDILSLQPFDRNLVADVPACQYFLNMFFSRVENLQARILIFSRWAAQIGELTPGSNTYPPYDVEMLWARPATEFQSKLYFQSLLIELRLLYPAQKIDICPVGDAVLLLDREAKAGRVPGIATAKDLFIDGIHFSEIGSYLVGCVYYATMFKEDPAPLGFAPYLGVTQPLADKIQAIAWDTVLDHPYSGVTTEVITVPPIIVVPLPVVIPETIYEVFETITNKGAGTKVRENTRSFTVFL